MDMRPPAVARLLVRAFSDPDNRAFVLEDLAERFREVARNRGLGPARLWYWRQALSAVWWTFHPHGHGLPRRSWAGLVGDGRSSVRLLRRRPLYAVGVSGTIGLGLGAATLVFAVVWRIWLAPMPYPDPDHVVRLYEISPLTNSAASGASLAGVSGPASHPSRASAASRRHQFSPPLLEDLRAHSFRTVEAVSAMLFARPQLDRDGEMQRISRLALSPDGFGILGIVPMLGRLPHEVEHEVLLSERFWRTEYGADSTVIGTKMDMGGPGAVVVGVARMPHGLPGDPDIINTIEWSGSNLSDGLRSVRFIDAIARVRPGHTVTEAKTEMSSFVAALGESHPAERGWSVNVIVLSDDLLRPFLPVLALLLAAGTVFLLLASVNVLGLVAARRVEGRHDRSIRLALGASEGRLLHASLVESLLLAGIGAAAGTLSAFWMITPVRRMVPPDVPRLADLAVTPPFMLAAVGVGVALGVLLGLSGYLVSRGVRPSVGRAPTWRRVGAGGRRAIVVCQVALTTLLTAAGAAVLHRVTTLKAIDLGFEPEGVSETVLTGGVGATRQVPWSATRQILAGLHARGIAAAIAFNLPMSGQDRDLPPFGIKPIGSSEDLFYQLHPISSDYFSVMGIRLLAGRPFVSTDDATAQNVVIVSEEFVRRYFPAGTPTQDVVGRVLGPVMLLRGPATIVGVVRSTKQHGPDAPVVPDIYVPFQQPVTLHLQNLLIRGDPGRVATALAAVVAQVDPEIRWSPPVPYTRYLDQWFAPLRLQLVMIGVLGALGLLLASLGLYALMAYEVTTRRQELGVRKAVGASDGRLMRSVLTRGMLMMLSGATIGLGAWYELLPVSRTFVDGIDAAGSMVPLAVALVVGGSCVVATLLPALKAMRVDPVETLKAE